MEKRTRVLIYGNTLSMAGIAASLRAEASLEITCVDPQDLQVGLTELNPETIIFDCSGRQTLPDMALLREQPGLLLVGVDPSSDDALVLSGHLTRVLSGKELASLVFAQAPQNSSGKENAGDKEEGGL